ncbi:MAG: 4-(cytidine 5'-diphospho)-2-C-methyl-D-erythritol kinase [Prevotella sp.]|nr:4-(cytidine 5'-diphospho)-2-C-methyl-D-erythritol kinase [Prevotella sp.]
MTDYPCAKINLGLNVVNKRTDGYHDLETVFYPVNINDVLSINVPDDNIATEFPCSLSINGLNIEGNTQDNLVVKAYNLLKNRFSSLPNVNMVLTKNIPSQAGMGGGSSDCAFTIRILNKLFNLNLSIPEMQQLAASLGADCAFFINPVPSYATGIGDCLIPVDVDLSNYTIAIVKPPIAISTKEAFSHVTPKRPVKCCRNIVMQPVETWKEELINDFEQSVMFSHPEIEEIKQKLYSLGAIYAAMSGSGSAIFGIFRTPPTNLASAFPHCFTAITN